MSKKDGQEAQFPEERRTTLEQPKEPSTTFLALNDFYGHRVPHSPKLFAVALGFSLFSLLAASKLFSEQFGLISVFIAVLGLLPTFNLLIETNKNKVKELEARGQKRTKADLRLVRNILALVAGVLLAYSLWALFLPVEDMLQAFNAQLGTRMGHSVESYQQHHWSKICINNFAVAGGALLLTLFLRLGGALLVLAWNASLWGVVFVYFAKTQAATGIGALFSWLTILLCVLPHTLFETIGYVCSVIGGILAVRLIVRSGDASFSRSATLTQVADLFLGAIVTIVAAALLETWLTPYLTKALGQ